MAVLACTTSGKSNSTAESITPRSRSLIERTSYPAPSVISRTFVCSFNDNDDEISNEIFQMNQGEIQFKKTVIPAMLTLDENIIRQDCLCYLMERISLRNK